MTDDNEISLTVAEALPKDAGRAYARMDPEDIRRLGASIGDILQVTGSRRTVCKAMPSYKSMRGSQRVQLDSITRENAGVKMDTPVNLSRVETVPADRVDLVPVRIAPRNREMASIGSELEGLPVVAGDRIRSTVFGRRRVDFTVRKTRPRGPVLIAPATRLTMEGKPPTQPEAPATISYDAIGGLKPQLQRIREMIELPLRHPEVFTRLGIDAPKGVLLHGPPGCGKTLIARAIAHESEAAFHAVNGPEIIHKFYGESEAHLRQIFDRAAGKGSGIIFMDEIDAIAPKREKVVGDVEKRVVAQLLALMDGLDRRGHLIVIAATNRPGSLDPALRRPGRFDREIAIPIPDRVGRHEILEIHSRRMPLEEEMSIAHLAAVTHGFVGADLQALCREAAMASLRRLWPHLELNGAGIPHHRLAELKVSEEDFSAALREVAPSAIREVFVEVPDVGWSDVGGLETVKQRLQEAVEWPLTHATLFAQAASRPPKGILLAGPPGCGKTLVAKAVARESRVNFISVKGPALLSQFVGASEAAVRETFLKARQAAPCIVFFDEIDALVPKRSHASTSSGVPERVLSQLLTEIDGIEELKGVCVLGATNRRDLLDAAILRPGRFDVIIDIPLPDEGARRAIFKVHLRTKPCARDIDLDRLSQKTHGFSGADIDAACNRAAMAAIRRAVQQAPAGADRPQNPISITEQDLNSAIDDLLASPGAEHEDGTPTFGGQTP